MSNSKRPVGRRGLLKGAAAGAAGIAAAPIGGAQPVEQSATGEARGVVEVAGNEKPGSDLSSTWKVVLELVPNYSN
jgi:hypothetical protein